MSLRVARLDERARLPTRAHDGDAGLDLYALEHVVLEPGEFELRLRPRTEGVSRPLPGNDGLVILDIEPSAELEAEGLARDVVRLVQQARRDLGLQVADRIRLRLAVSAAVAAALSPHQAWIAEQTLAVELAVTVSGPPPDGAGWRQGEVSEGEAVWLLVERVAG